MVIEPLDAHVTEGTVDSSWGSEYQACRTEFEFHTVGLDGGQVHDRVEVVERTQGRMEVWNLLEVFVLIVHELLFEDAGVYEGQDDKQDCNQDMDDDGHNQQGDRVVPSNEYVVEDHNEDND